MESIRRRLRSMGYLRTPVDRFLLGSLRPAPSRWRGLLAASLRVAAVSGPLLGILFLMVLVYHNHPHLYRPADLIVLYLYSSVIAGTLLAVGFLAVAAGLSVGRRSFGPRRGSPVNRAMAFGFTMAGSFGLYLGWRWTVESGGPTPAGSVVARLFLLAAILAAGIWLGSVLTRAFLGSLLRNQPAEELPGGPRRFGKWALVVFLPVAAVLLSVGLFSGRSRSGEPFPITPFPVLPVSGRLVLLGVDGLEWRAAPGFGPEPALVIPLETVADAQPPAVWTTLMTGRLSRDHGIRSVQSFSLMGVRAPLRDVLFFQPVQDALNLLIPGFLPVERHPVNSRLRRAKAVWEILAERGREVAVVNWWATWPARSFGNGCLVTERAYFKLLAGGPGEGETAPPELLDQLRGSFPTDLENSRAAADAILETVTPPDGSREIIRRALVGDAYHLGQAGRLLRERPGADIFLYLPGLDVVQTALLGRQEAVTPEGVRRTAKILEAYHRFLDLGARGLADGLTAADLFLIVGDPGRSYRRGSRTGQPIKGFLKLHGEGRRLHRLPVPRPTGLDLVPTILAIRGFPRSEKMSGTPLLVPEGLSQEIIATFGLPPEQEGEYQRSPFDGEMLEQLRSLGYLR